MAVTTDPIVRISMLSTGTVAIRPEHVASTWKPQMLWLTTSRTWTAPRPINVYVIEHRDGVVVFDTGQDRASVTDPDYFPRGITGFLYGRLARFEISPEESVTAGLGTLGLAPSDVSTVVLSHLHQDHIGGLRELSSATTVVSRTEWEVLEAPRPELKGLLPQHIKLPGVRWSVTEPAPLGLASHGSFTAGQDLFGDGSLVVVPTPGHTPGSQSLLVRRPGRPTLALVGDLTYDDHLLACGHVPGVGERDALRATTARMNELRTQGNGLAVLPAHDPGARERLALVEQS